MMQNNNGEQAGAVAIAERPSEVGFGSAARVFDCAAASVTVTVSAKVRGDRAAMRAVVAAELGLALAEGDDLHCWVVADTWDSGVGFTAFVQAMTWRRARRP